MSSSDTPPVVGAAFDGNSSSGWEDIRRYQREAEEILNTPGGLERYIAAYDRYSHSGPLPKSPDYQTLPGTTQWRNHPLPRVRALSLESENTELKAQITAMEETKHQSDEMIRNLGIKVDEGKAKIIMLQSDLEGRCSQAEKDSLTAELVVLRESLNKAEQKIRDTKKELQLQNERHQALAQTNTPETHDIQVRYEELRQQFLALQKDHQAMRDEHDLRNMKEHFKISQMRKSLKTILIVSRDDARSLASAVNMQLSMLEELADGRLSLEVGKWTTGSVNGNTCPDLDVEGEGSARKKRKNMHTGF